MRHHLWIVTVAALGVGLALTTPCAAAQPAGPPGFLGVMVGPAEDGHTGVLIRDVSPGSPAATAGVHAGDRVVKVGKDEARDVDAFMKAVATHKAGDKLPLTVERDGKQQTLTPTLGERPEPVARPEPVPMVPPIVPGGHAAAFVGVQVQPLTPELRDQLKVKAETGAVITEVAPGSPAEKGGLKKDDVVTAANSKPVRGPDDLREAVQQNGTDKDMSLAVAREGKSMTVKVHPKAGSWGAFFTPGDGRFPPMNVGPMFDQGQRIRDLEKRVAELEKKLQDMEHKAPQK